MAASLLPIQANLRENASNNGNHRCNDKHEQSEMPISDKCHDKTNKESGNPLDEDRKLVSNAIMNLVNITKTARNKEEHARN